jgi:hypothetical protein
MSSDPPSDGDDPVVEWYRRDLSRRVVRVLAPAAFFVIVGSVLVGVGISRLSVEDPALLLRGRPTFVEDGPPPRGSRADYAIFFGGLAFVVLGIARTAWGLRGLMTTDDDYLLVRASGIVEHVAGTDRAIRWDDIEAIRSEDGGVHVLLRDGTNVQLVLPYAGVGTESLAKRLSDAHRKGLWGFLGRRRS